MKEMDALDEYIENVGYQEILADGLMITDDKAVVRYVKLYRQDVVFFLPRDVIGKHISQVYPSVPPEKCTVLLALKGQPTISQLTEQTTLNGQVCCLLENTFPIKTRGKIIGAVSFAKYANYLKREFAVPNSFSSPDRSELFVISDIIGNSLSTKRLKERIRQVSRTVSPVLISGETGTGKEMVAQSIHSAGARRRKPFLSQNCSAIPLNLLESLLFGTTKGSYTGAVDRPGIFELANGGTIFLDEVNSMSLDMQAKILKVLEDKKVTRLGSGKAVSVDVRILSAMNEDPHRCIAEGRLRRDLFYRLSTVMIDVPALRDRRDDILMLADYFIDHYNREMDRKIQGLSPETEEFFLTYGWPGNVRELRNAIEGAFNFETGDVIAAAQLPFYMLNQIEAGHNSFAPLNLKMRPEGEAPMTADGTAGGRGSGPRRGVGKKLAAEPDGEDCFGADSESSVRGELGSHCGGRIDSLAQAVEDFERQFILDRMAGAKNLNQLAHSLGISRQRLSYKLKKYGICLGP